MGVGVCYKFYECYNLRSASPGLASSSVGCSVHIKGFQRMMLVKSQGRSANTSKGLHQTGWPMVAVRLNHELNREARRN